MVLAFAGRRVPFRLDDYVGFQKPHRGIASVLPFLAAAAVLSVAANVMAFASFKAAPNPGYAEAVGLARVGLLTLFSVFLLGAKVSPQGLGGLGLLLAGALLIALAPA